MMMRHFVQVVGAAGLLLAHTTVQALSIGNIQVKSTLNQRFNADITIALDAGENPNDIHVQLAPFDKFSERGIPWDRGLLELRFEAVQSSNNNVVIKAKSSGIISEPVLVFLLQARSTKGSVYRQFTVLLDPPAHYEPAPVRKPPQAVVTRPTYRWQESEDKPPREVREALAPVRSKVQAQALEAKRRSDWVAVRRNDSLSKIAMRVNTGRQVTQEQMVMALYNANPKAFFSRNINALNAGQSLRVPEHKTLVKLGPNEAKTEFYRQNRAWKERFTLPPKAIVEEAPVADGLGKKKLVLSAPTDALVEQDTLLVDESKKTETKPMVSNMDMLSTQVQDLQARLVKMEQEMANMQKLLSVKDEQLALLQSGQSRASKSPVWMTHLSDTFTDYLKAGNRVGAYIGVGLVVLLSLGLVGFYGAKQKSKETKPDRY